VKLVDALKADPGRALLALALLLVALLYAPVLGYGLVNHDDTWLVRDNYFLHSLSFDTLATLFFDTSSATRFILGAEYLPVRDICVALDLAVWGDWYQGHHLTSMVVYMAAIVVWFAALVELGIDRTIAGLALLLWAVMPAHAESVAWLSERKGLLGMAFAGACALGYAKFRAGLHARWLVIAAVAAVLAVWSKSLSAFAIGSLAPLELVWSTRRASARRAVIGLVTIATASLLAFVPVVIVATNLAVVGTEDNAPAGRVAMVLGLHGFYTRLVAMLPRNAISYPPMTLGPAALDIAIGAVSLALALAVAAVPARGWWRPPAIVRAGAVIWLVGFFPASRLALPLRAVLVADRYVLFPSLGIALCVAAGIVVVRSVRARNALAAVIVLAASLRTLDAQSNWRDTLTLWHRAVTSNPADGPAWAAYVDALMEQRQFEAALRALRDAKQYTRAPRLLMREALFVLDFGHRPRAVVLMHEAATAGEPRAMANLARLLLADGKGDEALMWARRAIVKSPMYARGYRTLGEIALAQQRPVEAMLALRRAHALWPPDATTRYQLALALVELHQHREAIEHLGAASVDPKLAPQALQVLRDVSAQRR
jgi:tetratricopeptide (TPR) repeat protein